MNRLFPMLAVETSGDLCSVAVIKDENIFSEKNLNEPQAHSKLLFSLIDEVLHESDVSKNELKSIAISIGPGSFTGLRIGLSAVKGIAFGLQIPIIPVPTFDAVALQIFDEKKQIQNFKIAVSANNDESYYAEYSKIENELKPITHLQLIQKKLIPTNIPEIYSTHLKDTSASYIEAPRASVIGKWAYLFGQDLLTLDHDNLEPNYFKNFIVKVKK